MLPPEDPSRIPLHNPPPMVIDEVEEYEVEAILDFRVKSARGKTHKEYLVKWKGYDICERTWEPEWNLSNAKDIMRAYHKRIGG